MTKIIIQKGCYQHIDFLRLWIPTKLILYLNQRKLFLHLIQSMRMTLHSSFSHCLIQVHISIAIMSYYMIPCFIPIWCFNWVTNHFLTKEALSSHLFHVWIYSFFWLHQDIAHHGLWAVIFDMQVQFFEFFFLVYGLKFYMRHSIARQIIPKVRNESHSIVKTHRQCLRVHWRPCSGNSLVIYHCFYLVLVH